MLSQPIMKHIVIYQPIFTKNRFKSILRILPKEILTGIYKKEEVTDLLFDFNMCSLTELFYDYNNKYCIS